MRDSSLTDCLNFPFHLSLLFFKIIAREVICPYTNRECFLSALLRNFGFENVSSKSGDQSGTSFV